MKRPGDVWGHPLPGPSKGKTSAENAQRILDRVDDEEIQLGDMRGGQLDDATENMTAADVGAVIGLLVARAKDLTETRFTIGGPRWRHTRAIHFLREVHQRKLDQALALQQRALASQHVYRKGNQVWRRETCTCGQRHPSGANFYVSVRDADRQQLLRGPFRTHAEAVDALPATRRKAEDVDGKAAFYFFGTVAMPHTYRKPGLLNSAVADVPDAPLVMKKGRRR